MSTYPIIEWDDQYPTEESVAALRAWFEADPHILLVNDFILSLPEQMKHCTYARCWFEDVPAEELGVMENSIRVHFATGGWSGAEDVIGAFWDTWEAQMYATMWRRGGLYVFECFKDHMRKDPADDR